MAGQDNGFGKYQLQLLRTDLEKHLEKPMKKGDNWFLIDNNWYKQLRSYLGMEGICDRNISEHPGRVDNKSLFKDDGSDIREHMIDELDYVLVPEEAWKLLLHRFGLQNGQEPIQRKVLEYGMFVKQCVVEVYYIEFQLAENSNLEDVKKKKFSRSDTIGQILINMKEIFKIPADRETRLWNKYTSNTFEQLARLDNTVHYAGLPSGQLLFIEIKNSNGTWPRHQNGTQQTTPLSNATPKPTSVCPQNELMSENGATPGVDVQGLNQIGNEIDRIQKFEMSIEGSRKSLIEQHTVNLNTIMEKHKKENRVWEKSLEIKLKKKTDLVKEMQGLLNPLIQNPERTVDTKRMTEITKEIDIIQTFEFSVAAKLNIFEGKQMAELTRSKEEQKKEIDDFERDCVVKKNKKKDLVRKLQCIIDPAASAPTPSAPECPVCMENMTPPTRIYNCPNGHLVCAACKPKMSFCTICRKDYVGRATAMEQLLRELADK